MIAKSTQALAWVAAVQGRTEYQAAKLFGISQSGITAAKHRAARLRCPSCGKPLSTTKGPL